MRAATTLSAGEQIKAIDEKIRSILMALSFFVAGMVTVFYATRGRSGPVDPLRWDGLTPNASTVFMVIFGGSVFGAVACALVALDPDSYTPAFASSPNDDHWNAVQEARFKASRFADSQAFVWLVISTSVLLGITQLPATVPEMKTKLVGLGLIGFIALSVLIPARLWWPRRGFRVWLSGSGLRVAIAYIVVPLLCAALVAGSFWIGYEMKWTATLYLLVWLLASRLVQHRARPWGAHLTLADVVSGAWCLAMVVIVAFAWLRPIPGIASFHH